MMDDIKVSVITVCRNSEKVLEKTIRSVLCQTYDYIEYIIIDGLSSDTTVKIAESYKGAFAKRGYSYYIVSESDKGIYDAMNKGIVKATGELIGLINSGDWYEEYAVEHMVCVYRKSPFDMFYADLRIYRKNSVMVKNARLRRYITTRDWNHPTTFIRRELYETYQYACRGIYDDWDLVLRIRKAGGRIVILNEVLANFCFGGVSNQKSLRKMIGRMKERYCIYRENGYSRLYFFECLLMELVKYMAA